MYGDNWKRRESLGTIIALKGVDTSKNLKAKRSILDFF